MHLFEPLKYSIQNILRVGFFKQSSMLVAETPPVV